MSSENFWDGVYRSASNVMKGPSWLQAGIVLNPQHYETYSAKDLLVIQNDTKAGNRYLEKDIDYHI